jgi:hypothetical protein
MNGVSHSASQAVPPQEKDWTVLIYAAGDNNLDRYFVDEHKALETIDSRDRINIVMQWDRGEHPCNESLPWHDCRRFLVAPGNESTFSSTPLEECGPLDMADPRTLADFITWGMKKYPAKHTLVVIKDHGHAFEGVIDDDSHGSRMSIENLGNAFLDAEQRTGKKPEMIAFDACGMANAETLMALRDRTQFVVASEKVLYVPGFPYKEALTAEQSPPGQPLAPEDLAKRFVEGAKKRTLDVDSLSAFDMGRMGTFAKALDRFSKALAEDREERKSVKSIFEYDDTTFTNAMDLPLFLEKILAAPSLHSPAVKARALELKKALDEMMIAEHHNKEFPVGGLSIANKYGVFNEAFMDTELARTTSWYSALSMAHSNPLSIGYASLVKARHALKHLFS